MRGAVSVTSLDCVAIGKLTTGAHTCPAVIIISTLFVEDWKAKVMAGLLCF